MCIGTEVTQPRGQTLFKRNTIEDKNSEIPVLSKLQKICIQGESDEKYAVYNSMQQYTVS